MERRQTSGSPMRGRALSNRQKINKADINARLIQAVKEQIPPQKQFKPQDYSVINNFLSRLELGDLCFFDIIPYAIALFGDTKAGKTTLAHYLVRNPLIVTQTKDTPAYELDKKMKTNKLNEAVIGMTHDSETVIPNSCYLEEINEKNNKVMLLDCPGYSDSKSSFLIITNAYFHYRVFSRVRNLKFILTFDFNYWTASYEEPVNTISHFFDSFQKQKFHEIKQKIFNATVFFLTKVKSGSEKDIYKKLEALKKCENLKRMRNYSKQAVELIDKIIADKKLYTFQQAQVNGKRPECKVLKDINQKTSFWHRQYDQKNKVIDMSNIKFRVGRQLNNTIDDDFSDKFKVLCGVTSQRFENAFGKGLVVRTYSLLNILVTFLNKTFDGQVSQDQFINLIKKYIQEYYIYGTLREEQKDVSRQYSKKREIVKKTIQNYQIKQIQSLNIPQIQKIQIGKMLIQLIQQNRNLEDLGFNRQFSHFVELSSKIIRVISQLKQIKYFKKGSTQSKNYINILDDFCYIVYRLIEEAQVFKIIFGYQEHQILAQSQQKSFFSDKTVVVYDMVNALSDNFLEQFNRQKVQFIIQKLKVNFFTQHFQIKNNQSLKYYNQLQKYCQKINRNFVTTEFNQKMQEIRLASRKSSLVINDMSKGERIFSFIKSVKTNKANLVKQNSVRNQEIYINNMNDLGLQICSGFISSYSVENSFKQASKEEVQKYLSCGLIVFKLVNNVHMIIQVYQSLKKKLSQKYKYDPLSLKQVLLQFADYAAEHGRKELALQNLQHAYHLLDEIYKQDKERYRSQMNSKRAEREKISQKIGFLGIQKRYNPSLDYYDQMLTKKFSKLIKQKELKEIINKLSLQQFEL